MVGCTRQSVNKLLGQFSDEGFVRLDREGILVTDLAGLVARLAPIGDRASAVSRSRSGSRRVSSRTAAAASAALERPMGPVRKTSRLIRRSPSGVTIAIETAVSPVRGRVRTAMPTSAPPSSRARCAKRTRSSLPCGSSPASASSRRRSCPVRRPAVRAGGGDSDAMDSSKRSQGASPSRAAETAAGPDLDDGERPAEFPEPRADRLAPGRLAGRPDVLAERDRARSRSRPRRARRRCGRLRRRPRSAHRRPRPARRSRRSGSSPAGALHRADPRPATRRSRPAGRSATRPGRRVPAAGGVGRPRRPTSGASRAADRAGRRPGGRRAGPRTSPGAVPFGLGSGDRRRDAPGLLEVELGERHPAPAPQLAQPAPRAPGSTAGVSPQAAAIASRVRSSGVGPSPPVETTRSARPRPARNASVTWSRSSGSAVSRTTRTPIPVSERASSPAFVSRVSPTVSSLPMLSSSAVRSRRRSKAVMFSQRSAPLAGRLARSGALLSSKPTPAPEPTWSTPLDDPNATPEPSTPPPGEPPPADRRRLGRAAPGRRRRSAAARAARPGRCGARCRHRAGPGAHRARQGRSRRDRRRGRQGRGARRPRHRSGHLRGLPARHRDIAVARGVAPRVDGLGRAPRLPVVLGGRDGGRPRRARHRRPARSAGALLVSIVVGGGGRRLLGLNLPNQLYAAIGEALGCGGRPRHPATGRRHAARRILRPDRRASSRPS